RPPRSARQRGPADPAAGRRQRANDRRRRRVHGRPMTASPRDELVFAALGGVGEIGMNLAIYGFGDPRSRKWLVVDFGMSIAGEEHLPGVDLIYPDIRYLVEERRNIAGIVLTHAHEDHIGALIDLWPQL